MSYALNEIKRIIKEEIENMRWDEKDDFLEAIKSIIEEEKNK